MATSIENAEYIIKQITSYDKSDLGQALQGIGTLCALNVHGPHNQELASEPKDVKKPDAPPPTTS